MKTEIIDRKTEADGRVTLTVGGCGNFLISKTFDCGQAFRFDPMDGAANRWRGIAYGKSIELEQDTAGGVFTITGTDEDEYFSLWENYLDLREDYSAIDDFIVSAMDEGHDREEMRTAVKYGSGIRILRQEPFETLISFIISQNNNIPRIKKLVAAVSEKYGVNGSFPTPKALVDAGEEGLAALKTGFRAGYIYDAAVKVYSGELELDKVAACEDYDECARMLCSIKGVGPKVSACALLFGFHKTEAFPIDVWMKKSLAIHYPDGFDPKRLGKYAGIAQQYMFYSERYTD